MVVYTENLKKSTRSHQNRKRSVRKNAAGYVSEYKNLLYFCKLAMNNWKV
jgi:hypothetical protein